MTTTEAAPANRDLYEDLTDDARVKPEPAQTARRWSDDSLVISRITTRHPVTEQEVEYWYTETGKSVVATMLLAQLVALGVSPETIDQAISTVDLSARGGRTAMTSNGAETIISLLTCESCGEYGHLAENARGFIVYDLAPDQERNGVAFSQPEVNDKGEGDEEHLDYYCRSCGAVTSAERAERLHNAIVNGGITR